MSGRYMVCMESTTITDGESCCMRFSTVFMSFSDSTKNPESASPSRFARIFTCRADSSPDTYSTQAPSRDMLAHSWVSSVDLPMPGSPPTSTSEPSTTPPPSTRSSSPMPLLRRSMASSGMASTRRAPASAPGARLSFFSSLFRKAGAASCSKRVFQLPHSGHLPSQRGVS